MEDTLELLIEKALTKAQNDHKTREMSLVITKIQEAKFWCLEHRKHLQEAAKRVGFGQQT